MFLAHFKPCYGVLHVDQFLAKNAILRGHKIAIFDHILIDLQGFNDFLYSRGQKASS